MSIEQVEKLTSIKCRIRVFSGAIRKKSKKIRQNLIKVKAMFATHSSSTDYMAPELLTELIRTRIVPAYRQLDKIVKQVDDLETTHNELNNVIVEFEKFNEV